MYEITRDYIKHGNARSGQQIKQVKFIVSHDIGDGGSTAYQNRNYFNNQQPSASAHTFIDDKYILEIVPLWEKAWHVRYNVPTDNLKFGADANDVGIGVELCHGPKINFNEAYKRYVWYHAYLCKQFNLDPRKHIVAHSELDPGRRSDPQHALSPKGISWNQFIDDVAKACEEKPKERTNEVYFVITGGVKADAIREMSDFLINKKWWAKLNFPVKQDPYFEIGGFTKGALPDIENWLKERNWYYTLKQQ